MCSIGEEDFGDDGGVHAMIPKTAEMTLDDTSLENQVCKRCNQNKCLLKLSHKKDPECGNCFMNYVRHKFKAALGSTKVVKRDGTVLLVADTSPESVVMCDMVKNCLEQNVHQRLHVKIVGVLVIHEKFLSGTDVKTEDFVREIRQKYEYLGMPLYYTSVASSTSPARLITDDWSPLDDETDKNHTLKSKISSLRSLTSQQEYVHSLRVTAITTSATQLHAQYVFTPEISLDLAKILLTNISLGRGASVACDVTFSDTRHEPAFKIIRPMRDLTIEEIHHYLALNKLTARTTAQKFGEDKGPNMSIQNLTAQFVDGLQQQFCGTVSTVFKTGERLKGKNSVEKCKVCLSSLDYENSETLFAIEYSRLVSKYANQHIDDPEFIEEKAREAVNGDSTSIRQKLCHSCRNIFVGVDDDNLHEFHQSFS